MGFEGIGASVPRLEDDRYMRGKGEFIADIRAAGMRDLDGGHRPALRDHGGEAGQQCLMPWRVQS